MLGHQCGRIEYERAGQEAERRRQRGPEEVRASFQGPWGTTIGSETAWAVGESNLEGFLGLWLQHGEVGSGARRVAQARGVTSWTRDVAVMLLEKYSSAGIDGA